ncbi:hypothetical protein MU582_10765 [Nocardioidaceae bacterium SCSIO 66511]|nr:hypothetical protein MU582_10765 [Nocardioidaceae bacterium SCSIO 66511]
MPEVRMNEVDGVFKSGQHYGGTGGDTFSASKTHQSKMEGIRPGFIGMGGNTAQTVAALGSGTTAQIAKHIADQAVRAVQAGKSGITGDEQAHGDQQAAHSQNEMVAQSSIPPINAV